MLIGIYMSVKINLVNPYCKWEKVKRENICFYFKGIFYFNDVLLEPAELVELFLSKKDIGFRSIELILNELNGNYSLIIDTCNALYLASDRVRSIPLFYSHSINKFIVSDDANFLKEQIETEIDEKNIAEFLLTGYVTNKNTLFKGIKQLQAGEMLVFNKNEETLDCHFYFNFVHDNYWNLTEQELIEKLDSIFLNVFGRLIESTKKRGLQIVVPLSGGFDSRLIVLMLKRLGIDDVICFSYGRKNDLEVKVSKKIANLLDYKWYFVEYSYKKWYECYHSQKMNEYKMYSSNLSSLPHLQDFLALQIMFESGLIPDNSVLIPGHTGMIAGGRIPKEILLSDIENKDIEECVNDLIIENYSLCEWKDASSVYSCFSSNVLQSIESSKDDSDSYADFFELFDYKERQSKYIINSIRLYEFFGLDWMLPLCDYEFILFFQHVPFAYRLKKHLLVRYIQTNLVPKTLNSFMPSEFVAEVDNMYFELNIVTKLVNKINKRFDVRWGRYFKHPLLFHLGFHSWNLECIILNDNKYLKKMIAQNRLSYKQLGCYQTFDFINFLLSQEK